MFGLASQATYRKIAYASIVLVALLSLPVFCNIGGVKPSCRRRCENASSFARRSAPAEHVSGRKP